MSNVKIFVVYHKKFPVFASDIFVPIQTGCDDTDLDLGMLKDNQGENISKKNKNYGELTAWYWVLKNYLPQHPEVEYIGFCHYRRFLDVSKKPTMRYLFTKKLSSNRFKRVFKRSFGSQIESIIRKYDVILPQKSNLNRFPLEQQTLYNHYCAFHPIKDLKILMEIINKDYPEYRESMNQVLQSQEAYFSLNFIMRKEQFVQMANYIFEILSKLERQSDWSEYRNYHFIRSPAFLAERFINVWIEKNRKDMNLYEVEMYVLCDSIDILRDFIEVNKNRLRKIFKISCWKRFLNRLKCERLERAEIKRRNKA